MCAHAIVGVQCAEHRETRSRSVDHRDGDRPIERHDGAGRDLLEHVVQGEDLRPVRLVIARRFVVDRGDRRLELIRPDRCPAEGVADDPDALLDLRPVPQGAVLFGEGDQGAVRGGPRRAPGIGQQHERQQPGDLAVLGQESSEQAREPDRLRGQVCPVQRGTRARRVALVEQEVEHVQDHAEPILALRLGRQVEAGAGVPDRLLRAADALGHRGLGDQEGVRDLGRRQAADRSERQRELRRHRERRVAAQEQERERVVPLGDRPRVGHVEDRDLFLATTAGALAAPPVDQPPGGHRDEPGSRVLGHALLGPLRRGGEQRLLHGVLARVEPAVPTDERAEDLRRELAQQVLDAGRVDRRHRGPRYAAASAARRSPWMSIFVIWSIACMALAARSGSGSPSSSPSAVGMICQDSPYRSFSHPHGPSSPPVGERRPERVDLLLRLAVHEERDRLGERVVRAAVERGELLALEPERHGHRRAGLAGAGLAVARDPEDLRVAGGAGPRVEHGHVELGGLLGLVVEPQERGDLRHLGPPSRLRGAVVGLGLRTRAVRPRSAEPRSGPR